MRSALLYLCAAALLAAAQDTTPLMNARQAGDLCARAIQLMESSTVAVPELNRAGAPLIENARQALINLRARANTSDQTYAFLVNLRAYLLLAESVPRPFPFPAEAGRQLAELRETLDRAEVHFRALLVQREALLRSPDRDNLARYADANQKLPAPTAGRPRVVFLGDSITDGWRLNEYFSDRDFVNRGISGQITGEMLGRFKADVIDLKPAAVLILAGTNDLARGVNVAAVENNLSMMADLAEKHDIKLVLASVLPVSAARGEQRPPLLIRTLNDWMKSACAQRGCTYLDYHTALVDKSGLLTADLADDGLHPNSKGYRMMAPLALDAIGSALNPTQQKAKKRRLLGMALESKQ
jgi:lysophospholipase L1-like esterase